MSRKGGPVNRPGIGTLYGRKLQIRFDHVSSGHRGRCAATSRSAERRVIPDGRALNLNRICRYLSASWRLATRRAGARYRWHECRAR